MANMAGADWAKAAAYAACWLSVVALIVFNFARAAAASARRWRSSSAGGLPPVGEQLLDPAVQLRRQAREDVLQVGPGFVPAELGRLQQAHDDGGPLAGQLAADEEPIFASEGPRPNSVLDVVIVDRPIGGDRAGVGLEEFVKVPPRVRKAIRRAAPVQGQRRVVARVRVHHQGAYFS